MTDKELRKKAEEAVRANEFPGDATLGELGLLVEYEQWCVPRVTAALRTAYREGVEALRDGLRKEAVADRIGRSIGLELAEAIAIRLLKGKP